MSEFEVLVKRIKVKPHDNADRLEIAQVDGYQSIVQKGKYQDGDLVAYIPEQSLVPDELLEEMNLKGKLAGSQKNRVKAVRLRGVLSQGICYPSRDHWEEGQEVSEELGITKWEPSIPIHLAGKTESSGLEKTVRYDIQDIKKYPDVIEEGEEVVFTEKIHGTFCGIGLFPDGEITLFSKNLGKKGITIKINEENKNNVYVRAFRKYEEKFRMILANLETPVFYLGEVHGKGVQDLHYGVPEGNIEFRCFDVFIRKNNKDTIGRFADWGEFQGYCAAVGIPRVPYIWSGPFSKEKLKEHTSGRTTLSDNPHIREGIVVRPIKELTWRRGRVIFKSVSEDYLTRKSGTEYN